MKLKYLDEEIRKRRVIANHYLKNINNNVILLPSVRAESNHVWHLFVIRTKKRALLQKELSDNGVQTLIHYPIPPHKQKAYKEWDKLKLPISELIHNQALSLPISGVQNMPDTDKIIDIVNKFK